MIIRPATLHDMDAIIDIAMEQVYLYPRLHPDVPKMRRMGTESISSASHFAYVGIDSNGNVGAVIIAFSNLNMWAQRKHASVVLWVSKIPGCGAYLLRKLRDWVRSRRVIKVAGIAPDVDLDPRIWKLAERIGFERSGGCYMLYN